MNNSPNPSIKQNKNLISVATKTKCLEIKLIKDFVKVSMGLVQR